MKQSPSENDRVYNILVYGIDRKGLTAPKEPIRKRNFIIEFEPFKSSRRFNEYDGLILFQGIFERYEWKSTYTSDYFDHRYDEDELDKRKKEAILLLKQGGFICFILNDHFVDTADGRSYKRTDLAKYHLNYSSFYRDNYSGRVTHLQTKYDEFRKFLDMYGAASTHFKHYNEYIEWRVIAEVSGNVVGMIINDFQYFVPSLIPDNTPEVLEEYFSLLSESITSIHSKIHLSIPSWVDDFRFDEEEGLIDAKEKLEEDIKSTEKHIDLLKSYKAILFLSGDQLVEKTHKLFEKGFGISVDPVDELKEDLKLLDSEGSPFCLCEVKGTNRGVKREHINQTDSHRERSGFKSDFPAILIINTHIKNSRTVLEKDQSIADEQLRHANKLNILLLRTIDLLALLKLYLAKKVTLKDLISVFTTQHGWLKVGSEGYEVIIEKASENKKDV